MFPLAMWKVKRGLVGRFRAFGTSMEPVIHSGSRVTIEPVDADKIELGDIVVVQVGDSTMLHLVKSIDVRRRQVEISGTSGPPSGWTTLDRVYGICTRICQTPVPGADAKTRRLGLARLRRSAKVL
jgi:Peptidase S24-like